MRFKKRILCGAIAALMAVASVPTTLTACGAKQSVANELISSYSFDELRGSLAYNSATGKWDKVNYIFNTENASLLKKAPSDPLTKKGVSGRSLYMDGMSVEVLDNNFVLPQSAITLSAFVAPRVFENNDYYGDKTPAAGHPRMTSVINYGNVETGVGFVLGYGRLGMWGFQIAVYNHAKRKKTVVGFYDPINTLPIYEFSHIAATFDGGTGYVALFYNGQAVYQDIIPDLADCEIVEASGKTPLRIGSYESPTNLYGVKHQFVGGLLDEVRVYKTSLSPKRMSEHYDSFKVNGQIPKVDVDQMLLDPTVFEGDRYRQQYHAMPPAMWMNEPHAPIYYKGRYHVFYQANPTGPYWRQIRWGHIVSDDLVHWKYVKDAVVPTAGVCPWGVWTGGSVVGPDGAPWLIITAGTNSAEGGTSSQNVAFAHAADPDDPDLADFVLEETVALPQKEGMGEIGQFRDPFCWYDDETGKYVIIVSSSVPNAGGTANVFTSTNMRDWQYNGYLYECPYPQYEIAGIHWECTVFLPVSTKDGSIRKWVLLDTPQYSTTERIVEAYYWIGTLDKNTFKFTPDDYNGYRYSEDDKLVSCTVPGDMPRLFDYGTGTFSGQTGLCYRTQQEIEAGKKYEEGRTVLMSIAQGKDAGTMNDYYSSWAHGFSFPVELWLSDDGTELMRAPIKEIESLKGETLFEYVADQDGGKSAEELLATDGFAAARGDCIMIEASFTIAPTGDDYSAKLGFRYNNDAAKSEVTYLVFQNGAAKIDRRASTKETGITTISANEYRYGEQNTFDVTILLDRSLVETYINGEASGMTRIYPKYKSDGLTILDDRSGIKFTKFKVTAMRSAYSADGSITPAYYGNVKD